MNAIKPAIGTGNDIATASWIGNDKDSCIPPHAGTGIRSTAITIAMNNTTAPVRISSGYLGSPIASHTSVTVRIKTCQIWTASRCFGRASARTRVDGVASVAIC